MNIRVRQGDTLWSYSQLLGIPLNLLLDANRDLNPAALSPGQTVRIPGYKLETYTVRQGDTLWLLAQQRGLPLDALFLVNPSVNPNALQIGERLNVPVRVTAPIVVGRRTYDYAALQQDLALLTELYPFIVRRPIGHSVMGKTLEEIQVGRGNKRVHINASFHANEWLTTPILMQTLNTYLLALTNNQAIRGLAVLPYYNSVTLSLVPMVNPDGVDLVIHGAPQEEPYRSSVLAINRGSSDFSGWKANIRGVDLNNQFPAFWERQASINVREPAPRDFPGYQPLTEPEAIAMAELTGGGNFNRVLAYHTQGKVIYWGFEGFEPPEARVIAEEFARVSGYQAIQYVASWAGYKDWFIQYWRRPGFTIELGRGINPLPLSQFDEIYEEQLGIFLVSLYM
ncbi:MAG TPA: LysM peptidoglycan-binding domain-containing protein [Peptococcaceae bacterium]|nr:LysM peptidoglycan-binding domain-containing protein [Peptococcaceae bacterium]